ncbi:14591_t:CDS:2 [Funneliformis geosporum]|uniref:14591_t:CDS:1 n=1 Tax=Funneliformis geosporum TaxID=1117311 RepID=A0A9W4SDE3_9GLOM|nr:14591_t:CDS:2 [Funneliformis geosporum]
MDNQESPYEEEVNDDKQEEQEVDNDDVWDDIDDIDMDADNMDGVNKTKPDDDIIFETLTNLLYFQVTLKKRCQRSNRGPIYIQK